MGSGGLVGRESELAVLRGVLDHAGSGRTAAVVVRGDAGIGKTALLDAVAADATQRGWRCLTVRGIEAESVLAYAGLLAAVQPLRGHVGDLPSAQARALTTALGWATPSGPTATGFWSAPPC
jgi:predicted ATPase